MESEALRRYKWFRSQYRWHKKRSGAWHRGQARWYNRQMWICFPYHEIIGQALQVYSKALAEHITRNNVLLEKLKNATNRPL